MQSKGMKMIAGHQSYLLLRLYKSYAQLGVLEQSMSKHCRSIGYNQSDLIKWCINAVEADNNVVNLTIKSGFVTVMENVKLRFKI